MERLKSIKETLIGTIQTQMGNLSEVDAKELGEVVDMVKDIEEAMYYCTIVEAMEKESEEREKDPRYYTERYIQPEHYRDLDKRYGKMYYPTQYTYPEPYMYYAGGGQGVSSSGRNQGGSSSSGNMGDSGRYYGEYYGGMRGMEPHIVMPSRDTREGRSPMQRRNYMETKELHQPKEKQIKELEKYLQELGTDMTEIIEQASPEEKEMLKHKLNVLTSKI